MRWLLIPVVLLACSSSKKTSDSESESGLPGKKTVVTSIAPAASTKTPAAREKLVSGQTFNEGMDLLCNSINRIDGKLDPSEMQRAVAVWIDENVTNADVRELFSIMADVPPSKRAGMMKAAAAKAGIASCAIAER